MDRSQNSMAAGTVYCPPTPTGDLTPAARVSFTKASPCPSSAQKPSTDSEQKPGPSPNLHSAELPFLPMPTLVPLSLLPATPSSSPHTFMQFLGHTESDDQVASSLKAFALAALSDQPHLESHPPRKASYLLFPTRPSPPITLQAC